MFAQVEHDAGAESFAELIAKRLEGCEVGRAHGGTSLDLDCCDIHRLVVNIQRAPGPGNAVSRSGRAGRVGALRGSRMAAGGRLTWDRNAVHDRVDVTRYSLSSNSPNSGLPADVHEYAGC